MPNQAVNSKELIAIGALVIYKVADQGVYRRNFVQENDDD